MNILHMKYLIAFDLFAVSIMLYVFNPKLCCPSFFSSFSAEAIHSLWQLIAPNVQGLVKCRVFLRHLPKAKGGFAPAASKPLLGAVNWHGTIVFYIAAAFYFYSSWHAVSYAYKILCLEIYQ
jgi:hypothetical protein